MPYRNRFYVHPLEELLNKGRDFADVNFLSTSTLFYYFSNDTKLKVRQKNYIFEGRLVGKALTGGVGVGAFSKILPI